VSIKKTKAVAKGSNYTRTSTFKKADKKKKGKDTKKPRKEAKKVTGVKEIICTLGDPSGITVDPEARREGICFKCRKWYKALNDECPKFSKMIDSDKDKYPIQLIRAPNGTYHLEGYCVRDSAHIQMPIQSKYVHRPGDVVVAKVAEPVKAVEPVKVVEPVVAEPVKETSVPEVKA
jgi:hypothetical protein